MKQLLRPFHLLLPALLFAGLATQAQTLNYPVTSATNTGGNYTDLGTSGNAISVASTDDANSGAQGIGFIFNFNGAAFTQFVLNTNGVIRLGSAAPSVTNLYYENFAGSTATDPLQSTNAANVNLIMPFNMDLVSGTATAEYRVFSTGTSPNRVCTIQWKNVSDKADASTARQYANMSFQTKLYENGTIDFVYGPTVASTGTAAARFPNVGLKGSGLANGQLVLALKSSAATAWSTTTFINTNYTTHAHDIANVSLPDLGRTYRFLPGTVAPPTTPSNDECANAVTLTSATNCNPTAGTVTNATQTRAPNTCAGAIAASAQDVWYQFVATAATQYVSVTGNFDGVLQGYSGTCTALISIGCGDASIGNNETMTLTGLTVGSTYRVRYYPYDANPTSGTFNICVTSVAPAPCADITNSAITGVTATSVTLSFTPGAGNVSYTVTTTPTGGTATTLSPRPTTSPITVNGLTPNTTYSITLQATCAAGVTSATITGTFTTAPAPPANDNPSGAVVLPVNTTCTPTSTTNVGATTTTPNGYANPSTSPATCGTATNPADVWYTFTTGAGQTAATVTVTGAPAGQIRVFSAASSAGPFTQVRCTASTSANTVSPALSLTGLTRSTTYYITVAGSRSGDTPGAFTICVTAPTTPAVTGLTVSGITNNTANVDFTAPTNATSFTITYTPAGGASVTVTGNTSPVILTGLASGTTYTISVVANYAGGNSTATTTTFTTLGQATATRPAVLGNGTLGVYPNPAQRSFTLTLPAVAHTELAYVTLANSVGQQVQARTITLQATGTQTVVDMSQLTPGIYTLRVKAGEQVATTKVVIN